MVIRADELSRAPVLPAASRTQPPVDRVLLTAADAHGRVLSDCTFRVSINRGGFRRVACIEPGRAAFDLPSEARPLSVDVVVTPSTPTRWETTGHFELSREGTLAATHPSAEFVLERRSGLPSTAQFIAVSPRVRDVTAQVLQCLGKVPNSEPNYSRLRQHPTAWPPGTNTPWPSTDWASAELVDHHYIAAPPLVKGDQFVPWKLNFDERTIRPDTDNVVLAIAGVAAPKLIAVSWPRSLGAEKTPRPTPFVIYFRPTLGQNVEPRFGGSLKPPRRGFYIGPGLGTYPFGWDFLMFGLWQFLNYWGDPMLNGQNFKGLPYQISASGKTAALVLPLNAWPPAGSGELGDFMNASFVNDILGEIQRFMFRRQGKASFPRLGRTALGAFSSGNVLADQFVDKNAGHPFINRNLKELHIFDPAPGFAPGWIDKAIAWAARGSAAERADKMVRVYTQDNFPDAFRRLLGGKSVPARNSFAINSADGRRTAARLTQNTWGNARINAGGGWAPGWERALVHQLIPALMLTDAMRRSGF